MGRFSDLLRLNSPFTGRLIKENGETYNRADHLERIYTSDISALSANGELYRAFYEGTLAAGEVAYFAIDIPVNYSHYGFFRESFSYGADLELDFFVCRAGYDAIEQTISGFNFDERDGCTESQSKLLKVTGAVEGPKRVPTTTLLSSDSGSTRKTSIQTEVGTISAYDNNNFPLFKYTNIGNSATNFYIYIAFSEVLNES